MYKVFINDKPLFFAQKKQQLDAVEKVEFYKYESSAEFYSKISRLQKNMLICLISNRPKESIKDFSIRKTKDQCLDLPAKVYTKRLVELTDEQKKSF